MNQRVAAAHIMYELEQILRKQGTTTTTAASCELNLTERQVRRAFLKLEAENKAHRTSAGTRNARQYWTAGRPPGATKADEVVAWGMLAPATQFKTRFVKKINPWTGERMK